MLPKLVLFSIWLGFSNFPPASTPRITFQATAAGPSGVCSLPIPPDLHVQAIAPTWVTLEWSTVKGAAAYRLRLYDVDAGYKLLNAQTVLAGTSGNFATFYGLTAGVSYDAIIVSICPNGIESLREY